LTFSNRLSLIPPLDEAFGPEDLLVVSSPVRAVHELPERLLVNLQLLTYVVRDSAYDLASTVRDPGPGYDAPLMPKLRNRIPPLVNFHLKFRKDLQDFRDLHFSMRMDFK